MLRLLSGSTGRKKPDWSGSSNPSFSLNGPVLSKCSLWALHHRVVILEYAKATVPAATHTGLGMLLCKDNKSESWSKNWPLRSQDRHRHGRHVTPRKPFTGQIIWDFKACLIKVILWSSPYLCGSRAKGEINIIKDIIQANDICFSWA